MHREPLHTANSLPTKRNCNCKALHKLEMCKSNKRVKMVPALKAFWVNSKDYLRETFKESKSSLPPFLSFFVVYNLPNANCLSYDTRHKHSYVHKKKLVYNRKTPHITSPLPSPPAFLLSRMNSPTKCRTTSFRDSLFLPPNNFSISLLSLTQHWWHCYLD